jgi:hypothetical protein
MLTVTKRSVLFQKVLHGRARPFRIFPADGLEQMRPSARCVGQNIKAFTEVAEMGRGGALQPDIDEDLTADLARGIGQQLSELNKMTNQIGEISDARRPFDKLK